MNSNTVLSLPAFHVKSLVTVLKSMTYSSIQPQISDLHFLLLIEESLIQDSLSPTPEARHVALTYILADIITTQLSQLASLFGIVVNGKGETYKLVCMKINLLGQTYNPGLIGWCWLYYRYVCVDLYIQPESFSNACNISSRTLRRYEKYAINRLLAILMDNERAARQTLFPVSMIREE